MAQFKFLLGARLSLSGTVAEGRMPSPPPVQGGKAPRNMMGLEREAHGQGGEGKMMWF